MESISVRRASDLSHAAKSAIEEILGRAVANDEEIRITAVRPGQVSMADNRARFVEELEAYLNQRATRVCDVADEELDAAIDEAVRMARRGE